ncbi:TPR-like protein [Sistotremastrum suecicum HHB10207 ss-3]|uniref:TPR-like protein n=1 Tax=Sistotremastrum suecicum HHB10207 ss-3 TaxID=1314776 RepID=A0A166DU42_9AGAM|nr:TPR-like protein [Sistotremastrum suecicum HHB10207 ss-3]
MHPDFSRRAPRDPAVRDVHKVQDILERVQPAPSSTKLRISNIYPNALLRSQIPPKMTEHRSASGSKDILNALKALGTLAGTKVPYLSSIVNEAISIYEVVQARDENDRDIERLTSQVLDVAKAIAEALPGLVDAPGPEGTAELVDFAARLMGTLDNISRHVQRRSERNRNQLTSNAVENATRELEEELNTCLDLFILKFGMHNLRFSELSASRHAQWNEDVQRALDETLAEQDEMLTAVNLPLPPATVVHNKFAFNALPSKPQVFFGREDSLALVLSHICAATPMHTVILGSGGIGKTSLALCALHDPKAYIVYGENKVFLSCEPFADADALLAGIGSRYGIQDSVHSDEVISIVTYPRQLRNTLGASFRREEVESLLSDLAAIPGLTLLVTLRGSERPSNIRWARPFIPPLSGLSPHAAKATFMAISDSQCSDEDIDELLAVLDNIPLAVTLVGNLAQYSLCSELLAKWNEDKTTMVTRGLAPADRLSSLDMSIRLSLSSERITRAPNAFTILQILSLLPDGLSVDHLLQVSREPTHVRLSISTLRQVALVYEHTDERRGATASSILRVLTPIREYIAEHHPITTADFTCLHDYYLSIAHNSPSENILQSDLRFQLANVSVVFLKALTGEHEVRRSVRVILDLGEMLTVPGASRDLTPAALDAARRIADEQLEADCLLAVSEYAWFPDQDFSVKRRYVESALSLYRKLSIPEDAVQVGKSLGLLSQLLCRCGQIDDAVSTGLQAIDILSKTSNHHEHVSALCQMSRSSGMMQQIQPAMELANLALEIVTHHRLDALLPMVHYCHAYIHLRRYDLKSSQRHLMKVSEAHPSHWDKVTRESALAANTRGRIALLLSRVDEAEEAFNHANRTWRKLGRRDFMADHHAWQGLLYIHKKDSEVAIKHLMTSMRLYRKLRYNCIARSLVLLGEAEIQRSNFRVATSHLVEALRLAKNDEIRFCVEASALALLGDAALHFGHQPDARTRYVTSFLIHRRDNDLLEAAYGMRRLGEYMRACGDFEDARSCYTVALGMLQQMGISFSVAECHFKYGQCALEGGAPEEARHHFARARLIYEEIGDGALIAKCQRYLDVLDIAGRS